MSNINLNFNSNKIKSSQIQANTHRECKFCFSDDKLEKLIDPCNCEGTMKYVHQECLEEWIKNGNKQVLESFNDKKLKIYSTICEICKYQMKYTKTYKNNLFTSIIKLIKSIFGNLKNGLILIMHSIIIYFLIKRLRLFYQEFMQLLKRNFSLFNPSFIIGVCHNFTVLISILVGLYDIYMFYNTQLSEKRKCLINFLPKSSDK